MIKLKEFMNGRPHDASADIVDEVIEYIEAVEKASVDRYEQLEDAAVINDDELMGYIIRSLKGKYSLSYDAIREVLDLEIAFMKTKGVI